MTWRCHVKIATSDRFEGEEAWAGQDDSLELPVVESEQCVSHRDRVLTSQISVFVFIEEAVSLETFLLQLPEWP